MKEKLNTNYQWLFAPWNFEGGEKAEDCITQEWMVSTTQKKVIAIPGISLSLEIMIQKRCVFVYSYKIVLAYKINRYRNS